MTIISASLDRAMKPLWRQVAHRVSHSLRVVQEIRSQKKALRSSLLARRSQLTPGWYRLDVSVAYRIGAPIPTGLQQAMSSPLSARQHPIKSRVVRTLHRAVPPILVRLKTNGGEEVVAASQLMRSTGGSTRLFSLSAHTVITYPSDERTAVQVLTAHAALCDTLPIVRMKATKDGSGIAEPLIEGGVFSKAAPSDQARAYRRLLSAYIAHTTSAERAYGNRNEATTKFDEVLQLRLPRGLRTRLLSLRPSLIEDLYSSPVMTSHGDLHGDNILLGPNGPVMVDMEAAGNKHFFFYDPLTLPYSEAKSDQPFLLNSIRSGAFAREFNDLLRAANMRYAVDQLWLLFLVAKLTTKRMDANTPAIRVRSYCAPLLEAGLV